MTLSPLPRAGLGSALWAKDHDRGKELFGRGDQTQAGLAAHIPPNTVAPSIEEPPTTLGVNFQVTSSLDRNA